MLEADLQFNKKLKPITSDYRALLQASSSGTYCGMLFTRAPKVINPGDNASVQMLLWAYPKDPCTDFQVGTKVLLKDSPGLTRAEGVITGRSEYLSPATNVQALLEELRARGS